MQFSLVADPPGSSIHHRALKARDELVSKLLAHWQDLAEIQFLFHGPGTTGERLPHTLDCNVEETDRYTPKIDDEGIDGNELLLRELLGDLQQERANVAKKIADTVLHACKDAYEEHPRARTFEARIMLFAKDGSIEPGTSQKFLAASLGQLPTSDEPSHEDLERPGGPIEQLTRSIDRLVANTAEANNQVRLEKGDIHERYIELTDKNMGMLDKFKDLVEVALTHARQPPEHYHLEATKLHMRANSHKSALDANVRAAMAHERQQTVQAFIKENPNLLENLLTTAATIYKQQQRKKAANDPPGNNAHPDAEPTVDAHAKDTETSDSDATASDARGPHTQAHAGQTAPGNNTQARTTVNDTSHHARGSANTNHSSGTNPNTNGDPSPGHRGPASPTLCRGAQKLSALLGPSVQADLQRNLDPARWKTLAPLFSCISEAAFRRQVNRISAELTQLGDGDHAVFLEGLRESIPTPALAPLNMLLVQYGLNVF
ncbi:MAG: hypothetical protein AAGA54_37030 [Myxococcota bacterium]